MPRQPRNCWTSSRPILRVDSRSARRRAVLSGSAFTRHLNYTRCKMTSPSKTAKAPISMARALILIGFCLTAAGVWSSFELERHSFTMRTVDFEFQFLEFSFLPELMLGLLTTVIGSVRWAWHAQNRDVAAYGLAILFTAPVVLYAVPINIHGWTAVFMFVGLAAMLIGALFLLLAAVRATRQSIP